MAEQQRERDIAEMEAQMAHDTDQYFEARPQIMRTRDKETTFEAGFKAAWAARPLSHAEGEAVDHWAVRNPGLADQFRAEAQTVRKRLGFEPDADDVSPNDLRERIAEIEGAPQVAVPEGYTLVPEDMLTRFRHFHDAVKTLSKTADPDGYWEHQCEVCKRIESQLAAAPTAPAGEQGDRLRAGTDSDPGRTVKPHRSGGGLRPSESDSGHMGIATEPSVADRLRAGKGDES